MLNKIHISLLIFLFIFSNGKCQKLETLNFGLKPNSKYSILMQHFITFQNPKNISNYNDLKLIDPSLFKNFKLDVPSIIYTGKIVEQSYFPVKIFMTATYNKESVLPMGTEVYGKYFFKNFDFPMKFDSTSIPEFFDSSFLEELNNNYKLPILIKKGSGFVSYQTRKLSLGGSYLNFKTKTVYKKKKNKNGIITYKTRSKLVGTNEILNESGIVLKMKGEGELTYNLKSQFYERNFIENKVEISLKEIGEKIKYVEFFNVLGRTF